MDETTSSSDGTTEQSADGSTTTSSGTDAFMEIISTVNTEGVGVVFMSAFLLTLAFWALGTKVGLVLSAIRKL